MVKPLALLALCLWLPAAASAGKDGSGALAADKSKDAGPAPDLTIGSDRSMKFIGDLVQPKAGTVCNAAGQCIDQNGKPVKPIKPIEETDPNLAAESGQAADPLNNAPQSERQSRDISRGKGDPSGPRPLSPAELKTAAADAAAREQRALSGSGAAANSVAAGNQFLRANRPQDAERNFARALGKDPDDEAALTGRMLALSALGRGDESLGAARQLLARHPDNALAKRQVAQIEGEGRAAGVAAKFKKLGDGLLRGPEGEPLAEPKDARRPAASAGGPPAAPASGIVPEAPAAGFAPLLLNAQRKQAVGDYTGALVDVSQQIDADPNDAAAWTLRAELDIQLSNYLAGVSDAGKALALSPDSARALRALSYAELETKLFRQALNDAARAVALDPKNGLGYLYKAMAEDALGLAGAESDLRRALALDPTLKRLAAPLMRKFQLDGGAAPGGGARLKPWMLRGGFVAAAMLLILFGLLGTQKGRALTAVRLTPRRAQTDPPAAELASGTLLGGCYRIVREIGRGGMGVVYEGFDEALQRRVAVKRLLQDFATTPDDIARFLREARLVAQLKHPNLAQIYAVADEREAFLVFEYVDGEPLDRALSRSARFTPATARKTIGEVAAALGYAHARGIIHRDLKPANVMIAADGTAKVMDFGIAHQARTAATQVTQTVACGTPPYMAPEQGMGSVSKASDLFALGVMTYELLTARRPFAGPDYLEQKLQRRFEPATRLNPELPAALDHFFAAALEPDPTKRPADAAAFMEAFGRACDATPRRQTSAA